MYLWLITIVEIDPWYSHSITKMEAYEGPTIMKPRSTLLKVSPWQFTREMLNYCYDDDDYNS